MSIPVAYATGSSCVALRAICVAKQSAVDVRKLVRPRSQVRVAAILGSHVHRSKNLGQHKVCVVAARFAHLPNRVGEQILAMKDAGVFGKEAKDQPGKEMIQVFPPLVPIPIGVVAEQFDVQPVQPSGRLDVERVFADLPNSRNSRQFQKVAEVVVEVFEFANQRRVVRIQAGRVNGLAVGGDSELCLVLGCGGAVEQLVEQIGDGVGAESLDDFRYGAEGCNVDVVPLQDGNDTSFGDVAFVGGVLGSAAKPLDGGRFVPECFQKRVWEFHSVKRNLNKLANGFFNFNSVQVPAPLRAQFVARWSSS